MRCSKFRGKVVELEWRILAYSSTYTLGPVWERMSSLVWDIDTVSCAYLLHTILYHQHPGMYKNEIMFHFAQLTLPDIGTNFCCDKLCWMRLFSIQLTSFFTFTIKSYSCWNWTLSYYNRPNSNAGLQERLRTKQRIFKFQDYMHVNATDCEIENRDKEVIVAGKREQRLKEQNPIIIQKIEGKYLRNRKRILPYYGITESSSSELCACLSWCNRLWKKKQKETKKSL